MKDIGTAVVRLSKVKCIGKSKLISVLKKSEEVVGNLVDC